MALFAPTVLAAFVLALGFGRAVVPLGRAHQRGRHEDDRGGQGHTRLGAPLVARRPHLAGDLGGARGWARSRPWHRARPRGGGRWRRACRAWRVMLWAACGRACVGRRAGRAAVRSCLDDE